jgi:hypothetical protein
MKGNSFKNVVEKRNEICKFYNKSGSCCLINNGRAQDRCPLIKASTSAKPASGCMPFIFDHPDDAEKIIMEWDPETSKNLKEDLH